MFFGERHDRGHRAAPPLPQQRTRSACFTILRSDEEVKRAMQRASDYERQRVAETAAREERHRRALERARVDCASPAPAPDRPVERDRSDHAAA